MKSFLIGILGLGLGLFTAYESSAQTVTRTFSSDGSFVIPPNVTSISVQAWGGGGGGSERSPNGSDAGAGGGGGGFAGGNFAVSLDQTITVVVGTGGTGASGTGNNGGSGTSSSVTNSTHTITAGGGGGGTASNGGGSAGSGGSGSFSGTVASQVNRSGGNGAVAYTSNNNGGGGGGGAGSTGNGSNASNGTGGTGGTGNGGSGGSGSTGNAAGGNGSSYGGGGGASADNNASTGGDGADGYVSITYTISSIAPSYFTATLSGGCAGGGGAVFSVSSSYLPTGTYDVTYSVDGSNTISSTVATMDFTAGSPGSGTFTTSNILNSGSSDIHITQLVATSANYSHSVSPSINVNFNLDLCKTWYSYENGNFNDANTWTLDPSGTTYDNGLLQSPSAGDDIVILNGLTVTANFSSYSLASLTIEAGGIMDMSTATGWDLGIITGEGTLKVKGTSLPAATYTDFVSTLGGTIEYYDTGGNLPTAQTEYNNLKLSNSSGNVTFTLVSDLTVNGTFTISDDADIGTSTWQINDNTNNQRTIILNGDLIVAANGRITVGTGNEASSSQHALSIYGNLTNNGIIKFYDPTDSELPEANYGITYPAPANDIHRNELQGNAVTVTFMGTTNKTVSCDNTTDFYRFVLNKGTGQQAIVTVNSSNTANFRLFGPSNIAVNTGIPSDEQISDNALSIINGTLELTGSINIPNLCLGTGLSDYFPIPKTGALWMNDDAVTIQLSDLNPVGTNKDCRILMSGLLRVTRGTINGGFSKGLGSQGGGAYLQEGGTVNIWQFRPRQNGGDIIFSFNQTGGTLNVGYGYALSGGTIDQYTEDYHRFDLSLASSTFQMSGGVLNVGKPTNTNNNDGGLFSVLSSSGNYNVTGGTVNLYTGQEATGTSYAGLIRSTAPLFNVNIYEETTTNFNAELQSNLIVLNNLTINTGGGLAFVTNNYDLTIGGSFTINTGTTFTPGTGIVTFNGMDSQTWTHNGTITTLPSVVMNKTSGILTLAGTQTFPDITSALTLTSGTLADGGKTLTVSGTGVLTNNATHTGAGLINYTSTASTINGTNGTFANLTIATDATIATAGKQTVTGNLRLTSANSSLNIGSNALVVSGGLYSNGTTGVAFGANKRILISGLHNAGGLTRQGASGDLLFPVGTGSIYTPATINTTATTHGSLTVRPVNSQHPVVTTSGQSLQYYWRVTSSGYSGITAVSHKTYTFSTATKSGTLTAYWSARYDPATYTWATNNTTHNATSTIAIPNFSTGTGWTGITGDQLDGEYTVGNSSAFGTVKVFYSRLNGNWNESTTWSNTAIGGTAVTPVGNTTAGTHFPGANNPVIIGDGAANIHTVSLTANSRVCATLAVNIGSTLDCSTFTSLNFGTSTGGAVSGRGTLRIASAVFPAGDFTNFLGENGGTVEWYGATKTIPTSGPAPQNLSLAKYYNLILNPNASNTITLPATDLTIYNNWTQQTGTGTVTNNGTRTCTISGNLTISSGTFSLTSSGNTNITVGGNVSNSGTFSTTGGTHTLSVVGEFTNNGTVNFRNTGTVALTFTGTNNTSFSGTGTGGTTLSTLTLNKGTTTTPTLTFNVGGAVTTTAATGGWLTITNGTFDWATANTTSLSTTSFTVGPTAKLKVSAGTVNTTSGNNDAYDLFLNGALEVSGTGTLNIGNTTVDGNNVDLEYGSAGVPQISIASSATLWVKGSIRRSTSTITGALSYIQTGGTVTVGGISSSDVNDRGVFEIDNNTGSNFTFTGNSVLTIQRQTGGTSFADVFINPKTGSISSTSTINLGLSSVVNNNFRISISPSIGNLTVAGTSAQTVNMYSNPLIVGGNLTIPTGSTLNTNSLNVTISGNLVCPGTYTGGTNNTTFNGTGAQSGQLSASSTFNDVTITKSVGTTLTLSGTSPILQNLYLNSGILDVGSLALDIRKNITNSSSQIGSGSILIYSTTGISNTITALGGSFTNLTLGGNASSKTVTVEGNLTINGTLTFGVANRYLFIKSNRLTFGETATVVGAGSTAFIRTNGVSSDLGVTKNWPLDVNQSFTYHIGTSTNYTPASYSFASVTAAGALNVIPVNSVHLTYDQNNTERVLQYNWIVTRDASLGFTATGSHTYAYPLSLITGTGGTLVAGYLDPEGSPLGWQTSGHGGSATTTLMTYTNLLSSSLPPLGKSYDYSVGTSGTLPNPIAPLYSRLDVANVANLSVGGSWTTAANWTTDPSGHGAASLLVPTGVPAVILPGARINTISRGRKAYTTTIDGLLNIGTIAGHNLGIIGGSGTMRIATNTFPAGDYTAFVEQDGGTIEYAGTMTMNSRNTYNNLTILSGSGAVVTMSATDLTINGNVTIPTGTTLSNTSNNADMTITGNLDNSGTFNTGNGQISIKGNWNNGGAVTSGSGAGKVTFNGSGAQNLTGTNAFRSLTIDNGSTLTLSGVNTVSGVLTLTSGNIISNTYTSPTPPAPYLQLGVSAILSGGSESSFVSGQIRKTMNSASTFTFPTGSQSTSNYRPAIITGTSATDTWDVSYVSGNATANGYNVNLFNDANLSVISQYEYWQLANGTGITTAGLTLRFGPGSYSGSDLGTLANVKIARWNGVEWDLPPGGGAFSQTGDNTAGTVSLTFQNAFSPHTIAGNESNSPLPVTWYSFHGKRIAAGVELIWQTATEINNDHFDIERSVNGKEFVVVGKRNGAGSSSQIISYQFIDTKTANDLMYYYRINQVDYDGKSSYSNMIVILPEEVQGPVWKFMPNPVKQGVDVSLIRLNHSSESGAHSMKVVTLNGNVIMDTSGTLEQLNGQLNQVLDNCAVEILLIQISDGTNSELFRIIMN